MKKGFSFIGNTSLKLNSLTCLIPSSLGIQQETILFNLNTMMECI